MLFVCRYIFHIKFQVRLSINQFFNKILLQKTHLCSTICFHLGVQFQGSLHRLNAALLILVAFSRLSICERSLLLDDLEEYTNSSECSQIRSATVECAECDHSLPGDSCLRVNALHRSWRRCVLIRLQFSNDIYKKYAHNILNISSTFAHSVTILLLFRNIRYISNTNQTFCEYLAL